MKNRKRTSATVIHVGADLAILLLSCFFLAVLVSISSAAANAPSAASTASRPQDNPEQTAVLAGGCFWGVDGVFKHVKGVTSVVSGYSGGTGQTAQYETVSTGTTGHAESVKISYDSSRISYTQLLEVFFFVAHDPRELNYQGPDSGSQYRSVIFYTNDDQRRIAQDYIAHLEHQHKFSAPIVTQVVPLQAFYPAEAYHQNFLARNPDNPYIVENDLPKLDHLHKEYPDLYKP